MFVTDLKILHDGLFKFIRIDCYMHTYMSMIIEWGM